LVKERERFLWYNLGIGFGIMIAIIVLGFYYWLRWFGDVFLGTVILACLFPTHFNKPGKSPFRRAKEIDVELDRIRRRFIQKGWSISHDACRYIHYSKLPRR